MDFDEYVVARRTRLVEHIVSSGLDDDAAAVLVDRVLTERRRSIERAADPDPQLYAAVERAVRGPSRQRRTTALASAVVVLVVVVAGLVWWVTRPPERVTVPSSFALDVTDAAAALERQGLRVALTTTASCEPHGLVLGSDPAPGSRLETGAAVTLEAAVTGSRPCPDETGRDEAWAFLRFTRGGPAPDFADTVYVIYDGREPAVLPRAAVSDPDRWASIQDIADQAASAAPPRLTAGELIPPTTTCGVARPATAGDREVLRFRLDSARACPFTVDLYRSRAGVIDAVVIYGGS